MDEERQIKAEAEEARGILENPIFVGALEEVRMDALLNLAETDSVDTPQILKWQMLVKVTELIKDKLEAAIVRAGSMDGGIVIEQGQALNGRRQ